MSPILICVPSSREWSRRVTFALQPQTAGHAFPLARTGRSKLGALYYLDTFEPVGAEFSAQLPKGAVTLQQHHPVRLRPTVTRNIIVHLSRDNTSLFYADIAPARMLRALELHAPVPQGQGLFSISLADGSILIAPCSELALSAYSAILRRDLAALLGESAPQNEIWFDGFRFTTHTDQSKVRLYPYRYARSAPQATIEAESLLSRALSFRTQDGGLPFLVRPATTGRVKIRATTHTYDDDAGRIHVATDLSFALPFERKWDAMRSPTAYAPHFFMGHVFLSAAGHHAPWKRRRNQRHHEAAMMLRRFDDYDRYFNYWNYTARVDIVEFGRSLLLKPADPELEAGDS